MSHCPPEPALTCQAVGCAWYGKRIHCTHRWLDNAQSLPKVASLCSLDSCPPAPPVLTRKHPDTCLPPSTRICACDIQHTATHIDWGTHGAGRWGYQPPADPTPGTTHTPSHKCRPGAIFPWIQFKGWRLSESHQLPLPSAFPAGLLSLSHKSPLAPLPSWCLKTLSLLESPLASQPPFPPSGKYPLSAGPPFSFPERRSAPMESNLKTGSPGLVPLLLLRLRQAMGVGRRLPECPAPPRRLSHGPAQN